MYSNMNFDAASAIGGDFFLKRTNSLSAQKFVLGCICITCIEEDRDELWCHNTRPQHPDHYDVKNVILFKDINGIYRFISSHAPWHPEFSILFPCGPLPSPVLLLGVPSIPDTRRCPLGFLLYTPLFIFAHTIVKIAIDSRTVS